MIQKFIAWSCICAGSDDLCNDLMSWIHLKYLLLRLCTTCENQIYCGDSFLRGLNAGWKYCSGSLNMCLRQVLLADGSESLIGAYGCVPWWGSPLLCRCKLEQWLIWDPSQLLPILHTDSVWLNQHLNWVLCQWLLLNSLNLVNWVFLPLVL